MAWRGHTVLGARARRDHALRFALVWALAFVVLPASHLLGHRHDHRHLPGGGVAREHRHDHDPWRLEPRDADHAHAPADHGDGGAEHLALALLAPAPALPPVFAPDDAGRRPPPPPADAPRRPWREGPSARGPPA
jgi:hypothetical protein